MKVVFMGTPAFAVPSLEALLAASDVVAVVTRPDQPQGRGLRVGPPPVAVAATQYALDVLQPGTLRDPGFLARLRDLGPDLFVVVAFGRIIPPDVLALASMGGINLHPSMLPRYRGAAPIPRAIAAGETATGVTVLHLSEELDAGDIILQRAAPIQPDDTGATLEARLARDGAALLVEALGLLETGRAPRVVQDSSRATFAPKVAREEAWISWSDPAAKIVNQVRAFDPWPVARTRRDGAPLEIWRAAALPDRGPEAPGTVVAAGREGLVVAAGLGRVRILEVQPPAGRRMPAADYLRGHPVAPGTVLGSARG
ncbi:MAG: methionyl-tRNA formyltransferase [Bacillati bacterium ANGP1]|uniref:Methionyl-tRNA formyltransferase n=1 Tax=Candidatus Segetimicrobium genomatis TaxID=2569760 RepID=A0A537JH86_9BACT|nr:MAG: methionyl-tRNA formyltransferase [Terrabacteria group bacterium ANGP1]